MRDMIFSKVKYAVLHKVVQRFLSSHLGLPKGVQQAIGDVGEQLGNCWIVESSEEMKP